MKTSNTASVFQLKLFIAVCLIVVTTGIFAIFYWCSIAEEREENHIIIRTKTIAAALENYNISSLSGTPEDVFNLDYVIIKDTLADIKKANPDVRFVYLMAPSIYPDKLLFLVDNEPEDSEDISLPGDIYNETTEEELNGYHTAIPFIEGPDKDEWGTWISAFAPIIDPHTGQTLALLGLDIDADHWFSIINQAKIVPSLVTFAVLVFLFLIFLFERKVDRIRTELISIASHQLSTPLIGIKWYTEALADGDMGPLNPKQLEYVKEISSSSERLIHLIKNLLNVAKIERGEILEIAKEEINVSEVIDRVLSDLIQLIKKQNVTIVKTPDFPSKVILRIDKEKIHQVFQNLISNAVKYSRPGGEIVLGFEDKGNFNIFSIKDSGVGIPKNDQPNIFEKFFRGSNVSSEELKGTGLGLYLVRMIVTKHGGELRFESEENKGTTFFVSLPKK